MNSTKTLSARLLSVFTPVYFLLGFVNIYFSYLALACMAAPFILLKKHKSNLWCRGICPRADFLSFLRPFNLGLKTPSWLLGNKFRGYLLSYFCLNIMFALLSTFMVNGGNIDPIDRIRLFIVFQLPWKMPQLWTGIGFHPVYVHLAFRLYSIMLSSTILGVILAILYKPRTWCVVCPVKNISGKILAGSSDGRAGK